MKTVASVLFRIVCTMIFVWPGFSFPQEQINTRLQTELVAPWLVTVQGQDRPRMLKITGVKEESGGKLVLDATFGWSDGNQVSVPTASVTQSSKETQLLFVTQAGTRVAAIRMSSSVFEGTFTTNDGVVKTVRIEKLTEDELRAKIAATKTARAAKAVVKPSADVPESCAAFSGQWVGRWGMGMGQNWLWVAEIDVNCMAKVSIERSDSPPNNFITVEIKGDELSFLCNSSTGGTCVFKRNGNDLWASYSNPSGGRNSAVFERLK